jgi:CubicO group peptidase (beta-lactamase class C family)
MDAARHHTDDAAGTGLPSETPGIYEQLESLIKSQSAEGRAAAEILTDLGTPVVSVAIMDVGNITSRVFGLPGTQQSTATLGSEQAFDHNTLFQAASISKPMTAIVVIKLCQEGKLDLDAPISRYLDAEQLSWISNTQTKELVSQISLRLLLSHTSGLSATGFEGYATATIPTVPQILRGDPPANSEPVSLFTLPGQQFAYSGGGFTVVQLILETCFKKPFHQIMHEKLLQPLKMTRSTFDYLPATEKNYAPAYWNGKLKTDPEYFSFPESAAAGLWTTPSDLLRAIHAVQLSLESDSFLERKWAEIMLTEIGENGFSVGWRAKKNGLHFSHAGGNSPGYRCFVVGFAKLPGAKTENQQALNIETEQVPENCGVSIMTSSLMGDIVHDKILEAVSYLKGWPYVERGPSIPFLDRTKSIDIQAKHWCGTWGPGDWELSEEKGLSVRYGTLPAVPLIPAAQPPKKYEEGNSIDLVADGLEMMLRLGWKNGARIIEVWQARDVATLEQKF